MSTDNQPPPGRRAHVCRFQNGPTQGLFDELSAPLASCIAAAIVRGDSPDCIPKSWRDPAAVADAADKYELRELAICHSNLAFIQFLCPAPRPPGYFTFMRDAFRHHAGAPVMDYFATLEPGFHNEWYQLLQVAFRVCNFAAIDWLTEKTMIPLPVTMRTLLHAAETPAQHEWLVSRGLSCGGSCFCKEILLKAVRVDRPRPDVQPWLRKTAPEQSGSRLDLLSWLQNRGCKLDLTSPLMCELLAADGVSWLLQQKSGEEVFALCPEEFVLAALRNGTQEVLHSLPPEWPKAGAPHSDLFFSAAAGGVGALDFVARRVPLTDNTAYLAMQKISRYDGPLGVAIGNEVLSWFHTRSSIRGHIFRLALGASCGPATGITRLNFLLALEPGPEYWQYVGEEACFSCIDIILWFKEQCARGGHVCFTVSAFRSALRSAAERAIFADLRVQANVERVWRLFGQLQASEAMSLINPVTFHPSRSCVFFRRYNAMRRRYPHAKLALLCMCAQRAARSKKLKQLPPELYELVCGFIDAEKPQPAAA